MIAEQIQNNTYELHTGQTSAGWRWTLFNVRDKESPEPIISFGAGWPRFETKEEAIQAGQAFVQTHALEIVQTF